jgi:hypothetical protein
MMIFGVGPSMIGIECEGGDRLPLVSAFKALRVAVVVPKGVAAVDVTVSPRSRRDDSWPTIPLTSLKIPFFAVETTTGFLASPPLPPPPPLFVRCR